MDGGDHEALSRTEIAMGERVARVETKIEGIEKDTAVIRSTMHGFAGDMQKFVIQEAECVATLKMIAENTRHLPEIVAKVQSLDELKPKLTNLMEAEQQRRGAWRAYVRVGTAVTSLIAAAGIIASGVIWALGKVMLNHVNVN